LGPAFTGVTTKSLGQTSLSYGTNQIIKKVQETSKKTKKKVQETSKKTKKDVKKIAKKIENFDLETKSKNFYASVTNLYLQDQLQKKESFLFHR
jgi:DNA-directed RNA polymerase alpha subunit